MRAYLPQPLPPEPPVALDRMLGLLERANLALGRLDGVTSVLPSTTLDIFMYVRKEALLSSQIEGTQSSIADLLIFETDEPPAIPLDDVAEVSNYVKALRHGLERMRGGFPLSLRLIREMHAILLSSGRGSSKEPGEFRTSQNWIGGTRPGNAVFVPPPPERLMECLDPFEKFLHAREIYSPLIRSALAHVQFETIHPFLDGNGRLGRLLIALMLCADNVLREPTLYLSLHLKRNRTRYYELLQTVRETGDWEAWIEFYLEGVVETADQGFATANRIVALVVEDRARIEGLGRAASSALRVHAELQKAPILSVPMTAKRLSLSQPTVQKSFDHLIELGLVTEITGRAWGRLYRYDSYFNILAEGTEPLPR